jgi:uncharacterized protein
MPFKTSVSRVTGRRSVSRPVRVLAVLSALLALVLILLAALTLAAANRLMRGGAKPLEAFSSNILPDYDLVSFPSLDEQTQLSGWFFPAENPVSTIIIVHDQGQNRLQFGLDSAYFYEDLLSQGFCVLAFDLRNSGQSGGQMSGYGYAEWADVLAAIRYVRKHAATHDVLLYGFGSGTAAVLLAMAELPPPSAASAEASADTTNAADTSKTGTSKPLADYPEAIRKLGFDQSYVRGLLLDTPCGSADDYIAAACRGQGWLGRRLLQYTVPYAMRLSTGSSGTRNLAALITRLQTPVFLAYSQSDNYVGISSILPLVEERQRLHPATTVMFASSQPGYTDGFLSERDSYLSAMHDFLKRFILP